MWSAKYTQHGRKILGKNYSDHVVKPTHAYSRCVPGPFLPSPKGPGDEARSKVAVSRIINLLRIAISTMLGQQRSALEQIEW